MINKGTVRIVGQTVKGKAHRGLRAPVGIAYQWKAHLRLSEPPVAVGLLYKTREMAERAAEIVFKETEWDIRKKDGADG